MRAISKLIITLIGCIIIGGCTFFQDKDEEILPAELIRFEEKIKIKQIWKTKIGKGSEFLHLSLLPNGDKKRVFLASHDGRVAAFQSKDGAKEWGIELGTELTSGPSYGNDRVVVVSKNGELICLRDDDGSEVWRVKIKGESIAIPLIRNDSITVLTIDGQLRNFSIFDGAERWMTNQDMPSLTLRGASSPIGIGNNAIAGFDNGRLIPVNIDSGVVQWESMLSPPSGKTDLERLTDIDGVIKSMGQDIYAVGYQSQVASIAAESGQILWAKELSSNAGVAMDEELLYAVTDTGDLVGMNRFDGSEVWRKEILLRREITAPTKFKSTVVVGDFEGYLHFFDHKTGELVSRKRVGKGAISGSAVVIDDYLYVQNESSEMAVFSIQEESKSNISDVALMGGT